ncbi:MAG: hypothetical protein ACLSUW_01450 [Akkermansia sp.]
MPAIAGAAIAVSAPQLMPSQDMGEKKAEKLAGVQPAVTSIKSAQSTLRQKNRN